MKRRIKIKKNVIPSIFTLVNLFFGFLAILTASQGEFRKAAWLIIAATLFDALDGKMARLFGVPSRFGMEFDSIADMVSFCTAPAVLVYFAYLQNLTPLLAAVISFIPLLAGGVRLARFNVSQDESPLPFFIGLPTPAAALVISSFILFSSSVRSDVGDPRIAISLMFGLALLMISHIQYGKIPEMGNGRKAVIKLIVIVLMAVATVFWREYVVFSGAVLYVLWGLVNSLTQQDEIEVQIEIDEGTH
ncbi:MAG: CDP-diacylglycerol--serine O-phosphatidyltransferase [Candidatus Marinimicrobia bacterium]|nr:CDP-diacylglycerol--serine O-phosphatidyltransferase [Candidatus Neomarinimicrobiota bacterium]MDP7026001.1 CDP-diacylglycerol--serine O-phosphatidyltransferase [Candidatus Neomarinimicrobiota bacterium]